MRPRPYPLNERVHLVGSSRHRAYCGVIGMAEPRSDSAVDVSCPFCSALYMADHPELYGQPSAGEDR